MPSSPQPPSSPSSRDRTRDDGCCNVPFLKSVLYIFNLFFWLSGIGIMGIAVWTLIDKSHYISLLTTVTYTATVYIMLITGGVIIIVGILGCCGACRDNRICLMTFAAFLLLIFLMEAVAGIIAYMYEAALADELERSLNKTMLENYMVDMDKTVAIDSLQKEFLCCGSKEFREWRKSKWLLDNPGLEEKVPDSCCISPNQGCAVRDHPSNVYYWGCTHALQAYLRDHLIVIGAVGLGLCCLQIFGIVFSCCLARKLKEWKEQKQRQYWR